MIRRYTITNLKAENACHRSGVPHLEVSPFRLCLKHNRLVTAEQWLAKVDLVITSRLPACQTPAPEHSVEYLLFVRCQPCKPPIRPSCRRRPSPSMPLGVSAQPFTLYVLRRPSSCLILWTAAYSPSLRLRFKRCCLRFRVACSISEKYEIVKLQGRICFM